MPDFLAPFHAPKFTNEEFETKKAAYNAKYGYTITMPAFDQVIIYKYFPPLTEREKYLWKTKKYDEIPPLRRAEIQTEKIKKRDKYLAQLGSPSPRWLRSAGAILTALDDAQDAVSTLACVGKITASLIGGATAAVLSTPLGWVLGAAAMLQMINPYSKIRGLKGAIGKGREAKRGVERLTDKNPFSKRARAASVKNIKNFRPSIGNLIEGLQTTQNVFGVGISLGPVMGFAQDVVAGLVRKASGQEVKLKSPVVKSPLAVLFAQKTLKSQSAVFAIPWESDMSAEAMILIGSNLARQVVHPWHKQWNPIEQVEDLENVLIRAPRPDNVLSLEIIEESGMSIDDVCCWPQNGELWMSTGDLAEATHQQASDNLQHFAEQNPNNMLAFAAGQNAHDFALGSLMEHEGLDSVETEYSSTERIVLSILGSGYRYPNGTTPEQIQMFEDWCAMHEANGTMPSTTEIARYAEVFCKFKFVQDFEYAEE